MALKDIFTMIKANKYTADGCEELNKAREAETEDARRTYQIGEISEATGLQKTANGWRRPANGKAPGAKTGEGKTPATKGTGAESKPAANVKRTETEAVKNGDKTVYRIKGTQFYFNSPKEAKTAVLAKGRAGQTYARPSKDEKINEIQNDLDFNLDTAYGGKHSMDDFLKQTGEDEYDINLWTIGPRTGETLITPLNETTRPNAKLKKENGTWKVLFEGRNGRDKFEITKEGRTRITGDAAPRALTGDTRIRVKKA